MVKGKLLGPESYMHACWQNLSLLPRWGPGVPREGRGPGTWTSILREACLQRVPAMGPESPVASDASISCSGLIPAPTEAVWEP